jgi:hypothetical protein
MHEYGYTNFEIAREIMNQQRIEEAECRRKTNEKLKELGRKEVEQLIKDIVKD